MLLSRKGVKNKPFRRSRIEDDVVNGLDELQLHDALHRQYTETRGREIFF
jgi:hypothetical protein